LERKFNWSK